MSSLSQFFGCGASGGGANFGRIGKEVYVGPLSKTWTAPDTCTEVEFHVWGGGGYAFGYGGGGGGGYVRHIYPISPGATFSITVGGSGGTSSVFCTSQSPTSPISATGGSSPSPSFSGGTAGGTGGDGSFTIAPGVPTSYTLKYKGGDGGSGTFSDPASPSPDTIRGGGGGSAGSPYGDGINGTNGGGGVGGNGGAIENIFGTGSPWYYMSEFRSGNVSLANTSPNQAGAFNGGAGRTFGPFGVTGSSGSPGGIGGGGAGGGGSNLGGVGLVILYHN